MPKRILPDKERNLESDFSRSSVNIVLSEMASKNDLKKRKLIRKRLETIKEKKHEIENLKESLDQANVLFLKHTEKLKHKMLLRKEKLAIKFFERFKQKGFTKWQKAILAQETTNVLQELMNEDYSSEAITKIEKEWAQIEADNITEEDAQIQAELMKAMFRDMGFDVDEMIDDLDFSDPTALEKFQEEFLSKIEQEHAEKHHKIQEELKKSLVTSNTDFKKLYKKLVKISHPDLAKTESERVEREGVMKRLSEAWNANDYLELFIIEKELDKNSLNHDIVLDNNQLDPILNQLESELEQLKSELFHIKNHHEVYSFVFNEVYARTEKGIMKNIALYLGSLEELIEMDGWVLEDLKTKQSTKGYLSDRRDEEEFFDDYFLDDF